MAEGYITVIIVTGFLGSGKTTLLSNWLPNPIFRRTAVIVNEFGQVGLDQRILRRIEEKTILLGGGCACCKVRQDLVDELTRIVDDRDKGKMDIDQVLIETSGLADPAPILFSIMTDSVLRHHYRVGCVISCLDAVNGNLHLDANIESVKQIAVSDRVIITKTDLVNPEVVPALMQRIQTVNPTARILCSDNGRIDPENVLAAEDGLYIREERVQQAMKNGSHKSSVKSIAVGFNQCLNWAAFGLWLSALLYAHGEEIYRVKGILDTGSGGPVLLNGVQHIIHPPKHLDSWENEQKSEIVFIMRDIDPHVILESLQAFQRIIGAEANIRELTMDPYQ